MTAMNKISIKTCDPDRKWNAIFELNKTLENSFAEVLRQYIAEELANGEEEITSDQIIWRCNLPDEKIDMIGRALKEMFRKLEEPNAYIEDIEPHEPRQV